MHLILRGKNLGFSLEDIAEWLALYDSDPEHLAQTRMLHEKVTAAIADLMTKKADIENGLKELRAIRAQCERELNGQGS